MVNFTIEEALANLDNPCTPKVLKVDVDNDSKQQESDRIVEENLANSFTEESWNEFCKKYGFEFFKTQTETGLRPKQIFVNYDSCAAIKFDNDKMKVSSASWVNSDGEFKLEYFYDSDLSELYEGILHAVFPKAVSELFVYLVSKEGSLSFEFFPNTESNNHNWEKIYDCLFVIKNNNSDRGVEFLSFMDKVLQLIERKLREDKQSCASVDVEKGSVVFLKNVGTDRSFSENSLEVISVRDTYITLRVLNGVIPTEIDTYRGNFWENFELAEDLEPEIVSFLYEIYNNVLDEKIINSILGQERYEGDIIFTQYNSSGSGSLEILSPHFSLWCSLLFGDKLTVYFKHRDLHSELPNYNKRVAAGFYTDVPLALALGDYEDAVTRMHRLLEFNVNLKRELEKLCLLTENVLDIFEEVEENVEKICDFLQNHGRLLNKGYVLNELNTDIMKNEENVKEQSVSTTIMNAFGKLMKL